MQAVADELGEEGIEGEEGGEDHVFEMGRGGFYLVHILSTTMATTPRQGTFEMT